MIMLKRKWQVQFFLLMLSVFSISIGYGIVLPILPFLLENRFGGNNDFSVAWHTGMMTGVFMFMLFICAPLWGKLSDNIGRRQVILIGLGGSIISLILFGLSQQLWFSYLMRALGGAVASAVLPVSLAYISDTSFKELRARQFAWMSASATFGFLIGPVIGGWLSEVVVAVQITGVDSALFPFLIASAFGFLVWLALFFQLTDSTIQLPKSDKHPKQLRQQVTSLNTLRFLALLGMFALGSFEVGIALQGQQVLMLTPFKIGILYMVCSITMLLIQVFLFSSLIRYFSFVQIIVCALLIMAIGLVLFPLMTKFKFVILAVGLVGFSSGVLVPILAYQASLSTDLPQGELLGKQTASGSLGQALGSMLAGVLFSIVAYAPFWLASGVLITGILSIHIYRRQTTGMRQYK